MRYQNRYNSANDDAEGNNDNGWQHTTSKVYRTRPANDPTRFANPGILFVDIRDAEDWDIAHIPYCAEGSLDATLSYEEKALLQENQFRIRDWINASYNQWNVPITHVRTK